MALLNTVHGGRWAFHIRFVPSVVERPSVSYVQEGRLNNVSVAVQHAHMVTGWVCVWAHDACAHYSYTCVPFPSIICICFGFAIQ